MAKLQLSLSSKKNKSTGYQEILIRFYNGKAFNQRARSGIYILDDPNYWDGTQMVDKRRMNDEERRYHNDQRAKIEALYHFIEEEWLKWDKNAVLPSNWLKTEVDKFNHPEKYVVIEEGEEEKKPMMLREAVEAFIEGAPSRIQENGNHKGQPVSHRTILQYNQMKRYLFEYLDFAKMGDIPVRDLDKKFYDGYVSFLNFKGFKLNTVGKHIKNVKAVINWLPLSERMECEFVAPRKCKKLSEEVDNVYLSTEELYAIETVELEHAYHDKVRDQFILLAWTGCRYSDLDKLADPKSIERGYFELEQMKTGTKVCIPIFEPVKRIFQKYNGELPPVISNQKFNSFLKEICQMAGITEDTSITHTIAGRRIKEYFPKYELVSAHTARRSFATNMFESGAPALVIMQITGHKTEKAFLSYIKTDPETYARMLITQWNKSQQEKK